MACGDEESEVTTRVLCIAADSKILGRNSSAADTWRHAFGLLRDRDGRGSQQDAPTVRGGDSEVHLNATITPAPSCIVYTPKRLPRARTTRTCEANAHHPPPRATPGRPVVAATRRSHREATQRRTAHPAS